DVMQADASLHEFFTPVLAGGPRDRDSRTAPDAVEKPLLAHHRGQAQRCQQPLVERQRGLEIAHRELYMGNAVDLHDAVLLPSRARNSRSSGPPLHSITSSARASSEGGMVRPRALAGLRLIRSSNLEGCSTGRSPGFVPLKILSM